MPHAKHTIEGEGRESKPTSEYHRNEMKRRWELVHIKSYYPQGNCVQNCITVNLLQFLELWIQMQSGIALPKGNERGEKGSHLMSPDT